MHATTAAPSASPVGPLGWKIVNASEWEKIHYFLIPFEFCNECEHMLSVNFLYTFSCIKCYNLPGRMNHTVRLCVRALCGLQLFLLSTRFIYVTTTSTWIPLNKPQWCSLVFCGDSPPAATTTTTTHLRKNFKTCVIFL